MANPSFDSPFVAIASIMAELSTVMDVAKNISLAAANAKAIAFRAGEQAKGFQPITDFINELANNTLDLVNTINRQASQLYQLTVKEYHLATTYTQFSQAANNSQNAQFSDSLQPALKKACQNLTTCRKEHSDQLAYLQLQLNAIRYPARAAQVIAANSRIEAAQAGDYQQSLLAIAESVDAASQSIHEKIQRCRNALAIYPDLQPCSA